MKAELALVIRGSQEGEPANWRNAVFAIPASLTCRRAGEGDGPGKPAAGSASRSTPSRDRPVHSDRDEIPEPNDLVVRFWNDASCATTTNTDDMEHRVPELVEFALDDHDTEHRRFDRLRHQSRGARRIAGWRDRGIEIERIGRMSLMCRPAKAQLGARHLLWAPTRPIQRRSNGTVRKAPAKVEVRYQPEAVIGFRRLSQGTPALHRLGTTQRRRNGRRARSSKAAVKLCRSSGSILAFPSFHSATSRWYPSRSRSLRLARSIGSCTHRTRSSCRGS